MPMSIPFRLVAAAAIALATPVLRADHFHLTVDTPGGLAGQPVTIRAGYLAGESAYTILNNRLMHSGSIAIISLPDQLDQPGPIDNWFAGFDIVLTSDFYFATGRLNGGNFMWELASFIPPDGRSDVLGWGDFNISGSLLLSARTDAATRLLRSFNTMIGGHDHAQGCAISTRGIYDATLVAWDSNGRYTDSAPVVVRFQAGALCPGDANGDGAVGLADIAVLISHWTQATPPAPASADPDNNGTVGLGDIAQVIAHWGQPCP